MRVAQRRSPRSVDSWFSGLLLLNSLCSWILTFTSFESRLYAAAQLLQWSISRSQAWVEFHAISSCGKGEDGEDVALDLQREVSRTPASAAKARKCQHGTPVADVRCSVTPQVLTEPAGPQLVLDRVPPVSLIKDALEKLRAKSRDPEKCDCRRDAREQAAQPMRYKMRSIACLHLSVPESQEPRFILPFHLSLP